MVRFGLALTATVLCSHASLACSVPVFRYALERWPPSHYDLLLFHHGPLSEESDRVARRVEAPGPAANLKVKRVNLAGTVDPDLRSIWEREGVGTRLPTLVLR